MSFSHKSNHKFSVRLFVALIIVGLLILAVWYIRQISHNSTTDQTKTSLSSSSGRYWIIETQALNELVVDSSARNALANDTIFVPGNSFKQLVPQTMGLHLVKTESFTSEASLASALSDKVITTGTKAILYDNEDWTLTPVDEQLNPLQYYQKAASLVHAAGYIFIGTPVSKTDTQIDVQIAPYVDVLDIQSQYDQSVATVYASHVLPIAKAARHANSKLIILAGLSTNPSAGIPTYQELVNDASAVNSIVQGYWLNIPSPGTACPKCHLPQPQLGIQFLSSLFPK